MTDDTASPRRRRSGGRQARTAARLHAVAEKVPFITRTLAPFEVLSEEGLSTIEYNADTILEQVGIDFREAPDALELMRGAGCDVDGERVRFPVIGALVRKEVKARKAGKGVNPFTGEAMDIKARPATKKPRWSFPRTLKETFSNKKHW